MTPQNVAMVVVCRKLAELYAHKNVVSGTFLSNLQYSFFVNLAGLSIIHTRGVEMTHSVTTDTPVAR